MPTKLEQAAARGPAVPLSASELARCFDDLWTNKEAAKKDLQRTVKGDKPYKEYLYRKCPPLTATYRRAGQPGRPTPALIRSDAPDPLAALESVVGPVVDFVLEQVVPAEEPDVMKLQAPGKPVVIEAEPAPVAKVLPLHPTPADELARLRAILGQGGRLTDLSSRLETAYQRLRPPDLPKQVPRRAAL